ncbi:Trimethyllysine dioxygenase, partial [Myriangium duriaei CBS 260.36]
WLRDHCPCSTCMNQITKQRQVNNLQGLANAPRARHVDIPPNSPLMHVEWSDGHKSTFEQAFVFRSGTPRSTALRQAQAPLHLWGSEIASSPPTVAYSSVSAGELGPMMQHLRRSGLVFISSVPATPEASESLLAQVGPIRNTHWGDFTVVTSDLTSKDTAWTSEALEPHNDNTYFSDAAGLQMLHMLSHTDGSGGASLFVDGFAAAQQLSDEAPEKYAMLASTGVYAHSSGDDGVTVQPASPMPVLRHDAHGVLQQVRWNNADRAGVDAPMAEVDAWYEAASAFQKILEREENRYWVQLVPGTPVIFDNWRLMHGRSEFSGKRTVCGGYVNYDDYVSRYKSSCYSEEELTAATVAG